MKKFLAGILSMVMAASITLPYLTAKAAQTPDHIIINQIHGNGGKDEAAVSHSFIELYNPTSRDISLEGCQVEVSKDGQNNKVKLALNGILPAKTSYLIRGSESQDSAQVCVISTADLDQPSLAIDNKDFVIRLIKEGTVIDNVTVVDGDDILEVSKQKSIRRKDFQDTAEGDSFAEEDFEIIEYKGADAETAAKYAPRSLSDGAWPVSGGQEGSEGDSDGNEGGSGDVSGGNADSGNVSSGDNGGVGDADNGGNNGGDSSGDTVGGENHYRLPETVGKSMQLYSSYSVGATNEDGGVAEIVKYNKDNQKMYVVSGQLQSVDIVDILADGSTSLHKRISVGELGAQYGFDAGDITSVDVNTRLDIIALAVQSSDYTASGTIVLLDYEGNYLTQFVSGVQPDMICFSPDGRYVMTADEGEPREGYDRGIDPSGSVTLVELNDGNLAQSRVKICSFTAFDGYRDQLIADKVIIKKNTAPSTDLEPEYIAVSEDSTIAYVSLQENNAVAALDLKTGEFISVNGLGFKDHSQEGNGLDLNKDGQVKIQAEQVYGVYMPDGLASVTVLGVTYLLTPNEGDAREWGEYSDIDSKKINGSEKKVECLANEEFDGLDSDKTYLFGARSFSIFRADTMELVYDSGDDFEQITAAVYPDYFNSNHKVAELEARSNKKGPEPEDVKTLSAAGRLYAFIGLERIGGIMMYDITDPQSPFFVDYLNHRDFTESNLSIAGDLGAEGICTIEAQYSPTGYPMILAANEISGTVSVIGLTVGKTEENVEENTEKGSASTDNGCWYTDWNQVALQLADLPYPEVSAAAVVSDTSHNTVLDVVAGNEILVPGSVLDQFYGQTKTLALHTGTGIAFSIAGQEILPKNGDLNLTLEDTDVIPLSAMKEVLTDVKESRVVALESKEAYRIRINLHMALGAQNAGRYANLYRYNEQTSQMEYLAYYLINEEGQAMFALPGGDEYLVTVTEIR